MLRALYSVFHLKSSSIHFDGRSKTWRGQRTFPDVAHVVPGGSADAPRIAMQETKLSHASRFRGRRSIWRGLQSPRARAVSWTSHLKKQCISRVIISWQPHYAAVAGAGVCCPVQNICILDVSGLATVMRTKSWLYTVYSTASCNSSTACNMDTVVRVKKYFIYTLHCFFVFFVVW